MVTLEELKDGQELAAPIKNKFGQILLSTNTILLEKHKKLLQMWGVLSVYVKEDNYSDDTIKYDGTKLEEAKETLKKCLIWTPRNQVEKEIVELALYSVLEE
ncbi:MAG TPA: hypothetical protein VMV32_03465 [Ignavibacteriaceae bacterium]|nr:hypothetical protein [Ignavibacteriaceae bacterium]